LVDRNLIEAAPGARSSAKPPIVRNFSRGGPPNANEAPQRRAFTTVRRLKLVLSPHFSRGLIDEVQPRTCGANDHLVQSSTAIMRLAFTIHPFNPERFDWASKQN